LNIYEAIEPSRWCELAQHNNLLSIVHSRHDPCISVRNVGWSVQLFLLQVFHHLDEGVGTNAGLAGLAASA
jgi:hypothetical protein